MKYNGLDVSVSINGIPSNESNEYAVYNLKMAEIIFKEVEGAKVWCLNSEDIILGLANDLETAKLIYRK